MRTEVKNLSKIAAFIIGAVIIYKAYVTLTAEAQYANFFVYHTEYNGAVEWALIKNSSGARGFACKCDRTTGSGNWKGIGDNGCNNNLSATTDKAISLNHPTVPVGQQLNIPVPASACCQSVPTVNGLYVQNLFNCS